MRLPQRALRLTLLAALLSSTLLAQATAPAPSPSAQPVPPAPPPPCTAPEHRQFDFWIGEWEVEAQGRVAGTNRITRLYGDCGLREEYSTPRGYAGTSFNVYDAARGVWHQTWVDNQGGALLLDGGLRDGKMVLEGDRPVSAGGTPKVQRQRITWTPNADGSVRQHWETSDDGGKSWRTAFDGRYVRRKT